jgi:hypothetical protein
MEPGATATGQEDIEMKSSSAVNGKDGANFGKVLW